MLELLKNHSRYKPVGDKGVITYEFVPQVFTDAYVEAWKNTGKQVYLIIEEINRGNCAQIFGDLFQLLDRKDGGLSEYSINADKDLRKYLEKADVLGKDHAGIKDGKLCIPPNLNIIATMNTSDQSLFPMDSAFKRRWSWEYQAIKYKNYKEENGQHKEDKYTITIDENHVYDWNQFQRAVNWFIKKVSHSEDKMMGDYFIKGPVKMDEFVSKVMFYLWNDICKDNYDTDENFFRYYKDGQNAETIEFTFGELAYDKNEVDSVNHCRNLLNGFMDYLSAECKKAKDGDYKEDSILKGFTEIQNNEQGQ